jgi:hypothetical protein
MRLRSRGLTFAGVALPDLTPPPRVLRNQVVFTQTAGGHTGAPVPRPVTQPPFWRLAAPLAWTTVTLTLRANGTSAARLAAASPFPRHYLYDSAGRLTHKSALIRYKDWIRRSGHDDPWAGGGAPVPVTAVRGPAERSLGNAMLVSGDYRQHTLPQGRLLSERPIAESEVHLLLDGLLVIEIERQAAVEVGPGAIFDPSKRTAYSKEHVRVRAQTPSRLAVLRRAQLDDQALLGVAAEQTARLQATAPAAGRPQAGHEERPTGP